MRDLKRFDDSPEPYSHVCILFFKTKILAFLRQIYIWNYYEGQWGVPFPTYKVRRASYGARLGDPGFCVFWRGTRNLPNFLRPWKLVFSTRGWNSKKMLECWVSQYRSLSNTVNVRCSQEGYIQFYDFIWICFVVELAATFNFREKLLRCVRTCLFFIFYMCVLKVYV